MSFSLLSHCTLGLSFWVFEFDIYHLAFHNHHTGNAGRNLRLPEDNSEELESQKWRGVSNWHDKVPTNVISHMARDRHLQLLNYYLCSLSVSDTLCVCVPMPCTSVCRCVVICHLWLCFCVCFQSTADAEMKATGYEKTWRNKKRIHKAPTKWGRLVNVSLKCSHSGQEWGKDGQC